MHWKANSTWSQIQWGSIFDCMAICMQLSTIVSRIKYSKKLVWIKTKTVWRMEPWALHLQKGQYETLSGLL